MSRVVAFDLDGTLSDWEAAADSAFTAMNVHPAVAERVRAVIERLHPRRDGRIVDRYWFKLLADPMHVWRAALPDADEREVTHFADRFVTSFRPVVFADVVPTLDALHADGHRLAAVSNSPRLAGDLAMLGLRDRFDEAVSLPPELRKPNPDGYRYAAAALGVEPADVTYVGDSFECDVEGALAAGMQPVWLDRHGDGHDIPAGVAHITTLADLPALILPPRPNSG